MEKSVNSSILKVTFYIIGYFFCFIIGLYVCCFVFITLREFNRLDHL